MDEAARAALKGFGIAFGAIGVSFVLFALIVLGVMGVIAAVVMWRVTHPS